MASESEPRPLSRPTQRQSGFNVGQSTAAANGHVDTKGDPYARIRTSTGDTVRASLDGDVEMGDDKRSVVPLPIPRNGASLDEAKSSAGSLQNQASDLANGGDVKLPSLHSTLISPRITTISSSHVSSGPASLSSQWSPSRSSDPHLYSISGQPYSNASVKPYLSTSFQTSAERGAGPSSSLRASQSNARGADIEEDDVDDVDDVFGNASRGLGLHNTGEPSPPQLRRSNEMDREEGDAAGVFSFSSPYFGPRSLETSDIPPLSPPPTHSDGRLHSAASSSARGPLQRVMSPSWTAASLGKLSLGGPSSHGEGGATSAASSATRPLFGTSPQQHAGIHPSFSRSLPGNAAGNHPLSAQARRSSFNKRALVGSPSLLHPHASYHRASPRARSNSRPRGEAGQRMLDHTAGDDDETDEDELMATREQGDDDDATEDEAEPQSRARYGASTAYNGSSRLDEAYPAAAAQSYRHPSGQTTTMSASYERAQSGLSRQYSSERYAHLAMSRHHPYALGPSGASPSNAGVLSSYSPSNSRGPLGRRRSSFGNGNGLSGSPSSSVMHALSHSPRYIQSIPTRDRPPVGPYGTSFGATPGSGDHSLYSGSLPAASQRNSYNAASYGESPDAYAARRSYQYGTVDDEDEDEQNDEDDHRARRPAARGTKAHAGRSTSASRPSQATHSSALGAAGNGSAANGEVESAEMTEVNAIRERLGGAANCSAFISKLWYLMCRPELYQKYIHWSESGDSVILSNDPEINNEFAAEVLPKLFKHGNNASFVRQLNLYGFQRVPSSRLLDAAEIKAARRFANGPTISTALQLYGPHSSFAHPRFKKDQESLLPSMKPRSSKKTKKSAGGGQGDMMNGKGEIDSDGEDFAL